MDKAIAIVSALLFAGLAAFIALVGSVHGPQFFPEFVFGYLCVAEGGLACLYFSLHARGNKYKNLFLLAGAATLGACMTVVSFASQGPLIDWEVARSERLAAATQVSDVKDEALLSPNGNPIGIRLTYSIRFPNNGYFWQSPATTPETNLWVGGWGDGRLVRQDVEPPMGPGKTGVQQYSRHTTYNFTTEFIPNFLMWNADKTKLCLLTPPPEYQVAFKDLLRGGPRHYKVSISGTKFESLTTKQYDPQAFFDSATREGAERLQGQGFGGSVGPCK
jgi:hypothetical protein